MDLLEFVKLWNATWTADYWWRQKYRVAFNSPQHRRMDPVDIKFDYLEHVMASEQLERLRKDEKNAPLIEKGEWIEEDEQRSATKVIWDKMDLSQF